MNNFVTQRFEVAERVHFKMKLGECYLCSDVYQREREFLVFAAQELYPTKYDVPVDSEERVCGEDFLELFGGGDFDSYAECFQAESADTSEHTYLSDFPVAALALVTKPRVQTALLELPAKERSVILLYLMGVRSYSRLADLLNAPVEEIRFALFQARRLLQEIVCNIETCE